MHGVAPRMCIQIVRPLLGRGAEGRSPGYLAVGNDVRQIRSLPPEILEPIRRQCRIDRRARDRAMPQVLLNRPRVVPLGGKGIAASVPKHVRVYFKRELHIGARPLNDASETRCRKRRSPLRSEHEG